MVPVSTPSSISDLPSSTRHWLRLLNRLGVCLLALCALLFAAWISGRPCWEGLAVWWVVDGPVSKADAIMVLGGGLPRRPIEAARLYRAGLAPRVLYSDVTTNQLAQLGMDKPETTLTREVLIQQGVPESALQCVGHGVSSTYLESLAVRDWVRQAGAKSVIIPTDEFHTRRVRWVFRKVLRPSRSADPGQTRHPPRVHNHQLVVERRRGRRLSERDHQIPLLPAQVLKTRPRDH